MEAAVVVLRIDRLGDFAFDLEADEKRLEKRGARCAPALGDGQRRRERRHRGMRQQAERAIGRRRELRVVVVHRMAARRVEQRGMRRGRHQ